MAIEHINLQPYKIVDGATDYPEKHDGAMDGQQNKINEMVDAVNQSVVEVGQAVETVSQNAANIASVAENEGQINTVAGNMSLVEKSAEVIGLDAIFDDAASGILATVEGDYFSVPSPESDEYLILYHHSAGPVASEIKRYPSVGAVADVSAETADNGRRISVLETGERPLVFPRHDMDTLPNASDYAGGVALYTRAEDGRRALVASDGENWEDMGSGDSAPRTFVAKLIEACGGTTSMYIYRSTTTDFMRIGYNYGNGRGAEFELASDPDNWIGVRGGFVGELPPFATGANVNAGNFTGSFTMPAGNRHTYTKQVGASFSLEFFGIGFNFISRKNDVGGIWEFTIDAGTESERVINHSTWSITPAIDTITTIVTDLYSGDHTLKAVFLGGDPDNPPSDTPRGWLTYVSDGTAPCVSALLADGARRLQPGNVEVLEKNTVPDGPIAAKAVVVGSGYPSAWVPSHSGAVGCVRDLVRTIRIGEDEIGPDIGNVPTGLTDVPLDSQVVITQTFSAYNPSDVDGLHKMWDGEMRHIFDRYGWRFEYDISITVDLDVGIAYPSISMACPNAAVDTLRLADGTEIPMSDAEMKHTDLPTPQPWLAMLNEATGTVAACSYWNLGNIIGDGPGAGQRLTERTRGYAKLYTTRWSGEIVPAGSSIATRARVLIADGVDISKIW